MARAKAAKRNRERTAHFYCSEQTPMPHSASTPVQIHLTRISHNWQDHSDQLLLESSFPELPTRYPTNVSPRFATDASGKAYGPDADNYSHKRNRTPFQWECCRLTAHPGPIYQRVPFCIRPIAVRTQSSWFLGEADADPPNSDHRQLPRNSTYRHAPSIRHGPEYRHARDAFPLATYNATARIPANPNNAE